MRIVRWVLVALVSFVLLSACPFGKASLKVVNGLSRPIVEVCLSTDLSTWGENLLDGSIGPGSSSTIHDITPGSYWLGAADDLASIYIFGTANLMGGLTYTWTVEP